MFGPYVYPILLCTIRVVVSASGSSFSVWTTILFHQLRHRIIRNFPRPTSQENADSATQPESVELRPVPRSARVSVVEPKVAETQPLVE